jgi:hypothetical protein
MLMLAHNVWAWISSHPEFWIPVVFGAFNWLAQKRTPEEYQAFPPRVAAFLRFMSATFPDPKRITTAIWQAWNNTHENPPS